MVEKPEARGLRKCHVMLRRTEGIVLRTFPFGEADLIVTLLTLDFGSCKVFAKSPRKITSRFGSSLEPLTHLRVAFWGKEETALPKLTQADIVHPFQKIRDSLSVFLRVSELVELTATVIPEKDANIAIFRLLLGTLHAIEREIARIPAFAPADANREGNAPNGNRSIDTIELLLSHYKVKCLKYIGLSPKLDACGRCGKKSFAFYLSDGAMLCESCATGFDVPMRISPGVVRLYEHLLVWDSEKIHRLRPSAPLLAELKEILSMHIKYVLAKSLKTELFLAASGMSGR